MARAGGEGAGAGIGAVRQLEERLQGAILARAAVERDQDHVDARGFPRGEERLRAIGEHEPAMRRRRVGRGRAGGGGEGRRPTGSRGRGIGRRRVEESGAAREAAGSRIAGEHPMPAALEGLNDPRPGSQADLSLGGMATHEHENVHPRVSIGSVVVDPAGPGRQG